jgi:hypothetical protein
MVTAPAHDAAAIAERLMAFVPDMRLRSEVAAIINEMSRHMPHATEDWRARLTEALA